MGGGEGVAEVFVSRGTFVGEGDLAGDEADAVGGGRAEGLGVGVGGVVHLDSV